MMIDMEGSPSRLRTAEFVRTHRADMPRPLRQGCALLGAHPKGCCKVLRGGGAKRIRKIRVSPCHESAMSLHNVSPGAKAPEEFNVIIEIPMNADPIKYEVDEESGALFVDRFMATSMHYPCNYGYIPKTLAD